MEIIEVIPKDWGSSIGVVIPNEIVRKENVKSGKPIRLIVMGVKPGNFKKAFGTLKLKKNIQEVMNEIDKGYD